MVRSHSPLHSHKSPFLYTMSNLASVQTIISIAPIPGADNIEVAEILGWKVVVAKKDNLKPGDRVVYIQIDTIVPDRSQFEFLRERKFRVRTIKLRKQISQGLIIPLPGGWCDTEGYDVTDLLGIKKYEKIDNNPANYEKPRVPKVWYRKWVYLFKYNILYKAFPGLRRKLRSKFPTHLVSITDEERIQNIPHILDKYYGKLFNLSYKLDGSSITIIHQKVFGKSKYRICSRRFELHDKKNDWYRVFKSTQFENEIIKLCMYYLTSDIIVQGECIGKFNGNYHNIPVEKIMLFNIYVKGKRLLPYDFNQVCRMLNIPHCPLYKQVILIHSMPGILAESQIKDILNPQVEAEGLVWRCLEDNFSFKVVNDNYLVKEQ